MNLKNIRNWVESRVQNRNFSGSKDYWEKRYASGGNSGTGSYDKLAAFKAEIINSFIKENHIASVIEFGCGDGNQLALGAYPKYIGLDVSRTSINICANKFTRDPSKSFFLYDSKAFVDKFEVFKVDLAMSLDVIYHLTEDDVFASYMTHLFGAAKHYVMIYSTDVESPQTYHVKHRNFTKWIETNIQGYQLMTKIPNKYPYDPQDEYSSNADFFIYKKVNNP